MDADKTRHYMLTKLASLRQQRCSFLVWDIQVTIIFTFSGIFIMNVKWQQLPFKTHVLQPMRKRKKRMHKEWFNLISKVCGERSPQNMLACKEAEKEAGKQRFVITKSEPPIREQLRSHRGYFLLHNYVSILKLHRHLSTKKSFFQSHCIQKFQKWVCLPFVRKRNLKVLQHR